MKRTLEELKKLLNLFTYFEEKFTALCAYNTGPESPAKIEEYHPAEWYLDIRVGPVTSETIMKEWISKPLSTQEHSATFESTTEVKIRLHQTPTIALMGMYTNYMRTYYQKQYNCPNVVHSLLYHLPYLRGYTVMRDGNIVMDSPSLINMNTDRAGVLHASTYVIHLYQNAFSDPVVAELDHIIKIVG